jgi:phage repressor protein C with HTH and peptisase S24 domain
MIYVRRVVGDSMYPAVKSGSLVFFLKAPSYAVGMIVIAVQSKREVIKRITRIDAGKFWLEGDNSEASSDSRVYGHVKRSDIKARLVLSIPR